jgi:hypothetical protein
MFQIVSVSTGEIFAAYDNGRDAGEHARAENERLRSAAIDDRVRVVRIATDDSDAWKIREQARFNNGTYKRLPWACESWVIADHFAHVSEKDSTKLAYTVDAAHGQADRQTITRVGRYLEQHYSDVLSQDEIRAWCARFDLENGKPALCLASDPDEIENVYTNGPSSCMAHKADYYTSPCHPVRVYGSGDFAVAYMRNSEGGISARAIVAPERQIFGRIYGDYDRLRLLLTEAGYSAGTDPDDWDGLRLLRIAYHDAFVAPYFDAPLSNAHDDGKFLIVDSNGELECSNTNGLSDESYFCECCEDRCGETYTVGDQQWCHYCLNNHATFCIGCAEYVSCEDIVGSDRHGDCYCDSCASDMSVCECCGHLAEDTVRTLEEETYCARCAENELVTTECGEYARNPEDCECNICQGETV